MNKVITFAILSLLAISVISIASAVGITGGAAVDPYANSGVAVSAGSNSIDSKAAVDTDLKAATNAKEKVALRVKMRAMGIKKILDSGGKINLEGKNITIRALSEEKKELIAGRINAKTGLNLTAEDINDMTVLRAYLSNGRFANIKYMPDRASAVALQKLKAKCAENSCTVELKEVGSGDKTRVAYEVSTEKDSRVLLIFGKKMAITAQVDAETGEIISVHKPWWGFMAKEKDEDTSNIEADLSTEAPATQ